MQGYIDDEPRMVISFRLKDARRKSSSSFAISTLVMPQIPFFLLVLDKQSISFTYLLTNKVIASPRESRPIVLLSLPSLIVFVLWYSVSVNYDGEARELAYAKIWVPNVKQNRGLM